MPGKLLLILTLVILVVIVIGVGVVAAQQDSSYTVQYGDVLDIIAASMDMSADCIAKSSGLENPNKLRPGDTLIFDTDCPPYDGLIPIERDGAPLTGGVAISVGAAGQGGGSTSSGDGNTYTVKRGDVLDLIAAAYDVSVSCLADANSLPKSAKIYIGDQLTIDRSCPPYDGEAFVPNPRSEDEILGQGGGSARVYFVRVGDVLDLIGARFNLSPSCLAQSNNLTNPSLIYPGDQITIDPGCPSYDGLALGGSSS